MINKLNDKHRVGKLLPFPQMKIYLLKMLFTVVIVAAGLKSNAQENKAIDLTTKGLQIGQQVPNITINNLHNYKDKNGKSATSAKISDFKGKLLILDFWATWCSPCVAMIPKMDSLQKAFGDKIQFVSVTYQTEKEALTFLEKFEIQQKKKYDLPIVTDSKALHRFFPHSALPHYVWVDGNGIVKAITGHNEVTKENIDKLLKVNSIALTPKEDIRVVYDRSKPIFYDNNAAIRSLFKQSSFSGFNEQLGRGYVQNITTTSEGGLKWLTARNLPIPGLLQMAYNKEIKETMVEVNDSSRLVSSAKSQAYRDWLRQGNAFCYEIVIDTSLAYKGFEIVQQDLKLFFNTYDFGLEKRKVKSLALIRTSNKDKLKTSGGTPNAKFDRFGAQMTSCYLKVFLSRMKYFLQAHPLPLVDETGYQFMADITLSVNLSNVSELNKALSKYDLQFVEKEAIVEMLVIKDKKNSYKQINTKTL